MLTNRTGDQSPNDEHHHSDASYGEHDQKGRNEVEGQGDLNQTAGMLACNWTTILGCRQPCDSSESWRSLFSHHDRESFACFER